MRFELAPLALLFAGCGDLGGGTGLGLGDGVDNERPVPGEAGDPETNRQNWMPGASGDARTAPGAQNVDAAARAAWERASQGVLVAQVSGTKDHRDVWGVVRLRAVGDQVEVESNIDGLGGGTHAYHVHEYGDCSAPAEDSMGPHAKFDQLTQQTASVGRQPSSTAGGDRLNEATGVRPGVVPGQGMAGADTPAAGAQGGADAAHDGAHVHGGAGTPGTDVATTTDPGALATPSPMVDGNLGELVAAEGSAQATAVVPKLTANDLPALVGRSVVIHEHGNTAEVPSGEAGAPIACGVIGVAGPDATIIPADQLEDDIPADDALPEGTPPVRTGAGAG